MDYLPGIMMAYTAFLLGTASPGPNILAIIGTSMSQGRRSGVALAMGIAAGSFCWATLTAAGLSALLANYASALIVIKTLGGVYLLWLAYQAIKSAASPHAIEAKALAGGPRTLRGYATRGFVIQMTNPKAALTWIAIISLGIQAGAPWWVEATIMIGTSVLSLMIHGLYAIAFSTPLVVRAYARARRCIQAVLGAFFALAGVKLLSDGS